MIDENPPEDTSLLWGEGLVSENFVNPNEQVVNLFNTGEQVTDYPNPISGYFNGTDIFYFEATDSTVSVYKNNDMVDSITMVNLFGASIAGDSIIVNNNKMFIKGSGKKTSDSSTYDLNFLAEFDITTEKITNYFIFEPSTLSGYARLDYRFIKISNNYYLIPGDNEQPAVYVFDSNGLILQDIQFPSGHADIVLLDEQNKLLKIYGRFFNEDGNTTSNKVVDFNYLNYSYTISEGEPAVGFNRAGGFYYNKSFYYTLMSDKETLINTTQKSAQTGANLKLAVTTYGVKNGIFISSWLIFRTTNTFMQPSSATNTGRYTVTQAGTKYANFTIPQGVALTEGITNSIVIGSADGSDITLYSKYAQLYVDGVRYPLRKYNPDTGVWERLDNFFGEE